MDAQTAQQVLIEQVYAPQFVKACAARGIPLNNVEDLHAALETVQMLKVAEAQAQQQGIDTRPSPVKNANGLLKQAMFGQAQQQQQRMTEKQAQVYQAATNPAVQEAILSLLQQ